MLVWCYFLLLFKLLNLSISSTIASDQIYFKSPEYLTKNPNFTIGAIFKLQKRSGLPDALGISEAITLYCSLRQYQNGEGKVSVNGTFNLLGFEENEQIEYQVNTLITKLEGQDLYYVGNNSQFGSIPDTPVGTIFLSTKLNKIYYLYAPVAYFPIPLIATAELSDSNAEDYFSQEASAAGYGLQIASGPVSLILGSAIFDLLFAFNWSLVGLMYSNDPYGSAALSAKIDLAGFTDSVAVVCTQIYMNSTSVSQFSSCVKGSSLTRVIILWMSLQDASTVAQQIISDTGYTNELVFIIPFAEENNIGKYQLPVMSFYLTRLYNKNAFSLTDCIQELKESSNDQFIPLPLLEKYFLGEFKCNLLDDSLPSCPDEIGNRTSPCHCTGDETTESSFVADNVDLFMSAINLLQYNCSGLTEKMTVYYPNLTIPDYCALTKFNTLQLSLALKAVQIDSYNGTQSVDQFTSTRSAVTLNLIQVQPDGPVFLGKYSQFNLTLNTSRAFFYQNITSEVVPDNPSFTNSALAAVGFTVDIVLMALTLSVMVFVLWNAKHPVIRKSSPIFCVIILVGIFFVELAFFFYCFSLSDVICQLDDWFGITGVALVIGSLLAKSYRIYVIFNNQSGQAVGVSELLLLACTCVILVIVWVMMVLYITLGGGLKAATVQSSSDQFYSYVLCEVPSETFQLIFLISFYVYFILLFLAAAILAFLNRKVSSVYSESSAVGLVVYLWIGVVIVYAPIYYVQGGSTNSNQVRFALRFIATLLACSFTLIFLFYPKIAQVLRKKKTRPFRAQ